MTTESLEPARSEPGTDAAAFGIFPVIVRFKGRPSDTVFHLLRGRGFQYGNHAWYGEGVPAELRALVDDCGGVVEVGECVGGQLVTRHNPFRHD